MGLFQNGVFQNALLQNGLFQNAQLHNGLFHNGPFHVYKLCTLCVFVKKCRPVYTDINIQICMHVLLHSHPVVWYGGCSGYHHHCHQT